MSPAWIFEHFKKVLLSAKPDEIIVLQFHGVPDEKHPWVNTPPAAFREYMMCLKQNGYRTLALLLTHTPSRIAIAERAEAGYLEPRGKNYEHHT